MAGTAILKGYLFLYNALLAIGWAFVLGNLCYGIYIDNPWGAVEMSLKISQTAAVMEIIHPLIGLVRTNLISTLLQVGSRLYLLWVVADAFEVTGKFLAFRTMVIAWSLSEIPRYSYFAIAQIQKPPYWMTWLRYTSFMPLYPIGVASEVTCLYSVLPLIFDQRPYSMYLPNKLNFAFDTYYFSIFSLFLYIPGLPFMYTHMLAQRAKYLGGAATTSKTAVTAKKAE